MIGYPILHILYCLLGILRNASICLLNLAFSCLLLSGLDVFNLCI